MSINIATFPSDIRRTFELQRMASLWVSHVCAGKWTRDRVRLEVCKIDDEGEREQLRAWLRHYDAQAKAAAAVANSKKTSTRRPRYDAR